MKIWSTFKSYLTSVKHVWKFTVPVHIGAVLAVVYAAVTGQFLAFAAIATIMWALLSIGVEVGGHRLFSHKAFETYRPVEIALMILATLAAQGSVLFWVAVHRGYHHPHADTEKDLHSPVAHGVWHAYHGWLIHLETPNMRAAAPLMRDKWQMWLHNHFYRVLMGFMLLLLIVGGPLWLGAYLLANAVCSQQNYLVNIICHDHRFGTREHVTKCHSRNVGWLSIPSWGLSLHNNHHHDPANANLATTPGQIDISNWVIRLIQRRSNGTTAQV